MNVRSIITATSLAILCSAVHPAEPSVCTHFRQLGWPSHAKLYERALTRSLDIGAKEDGTDHFFNIDVNGDDIEDQVTLSCSRSSMPADPCMLEVKMSTGSSYTFEAWKMFLVRFGRGVFAITSDYEESKDPKPNKIYRLREAGASLVCEAPR